MENRMDWMTWKRERGVPATNGLWWGIVLLICTGLPAKGVMASGRKCISENLKLATLLEKKGKKSDALASYRDALKCDVSKTLKKHAHARLAILYLKLGCVSCAQFQFCQVKSLVSPKELPDTAPPKAKELLQAIRKGEQPCPALAQDLQKEAYVPVKQKKKKWHAQVKVQIHDPQIAKGRLFFSVPWVSGFLQQDKPCKDTSCTFSLKLDPPKKKKPVLQYHYRLMLGKKGHDLYDKKDKPFRKALVPESFLKNKACEKIEGSPLKKDSKLKAILGWVKECEKASKKGWKAPPWLIPTLAAVGGILVGAAAGVITCAVIPDCKLGGN